MAGLALATWIAWPLPPGLVAPAETQSLTIEDRHGLTLRTTRAADGSLVGWAPLDRMDADLLLAFITFEDRRFYDHHGIDLRSVARALRDNLRRRQVVSGASTITMQLARLLRPIGRGWTDKVRQAFWALRLEAHLSKQEILEQYLNRVPLGQGAVGVAAGAALYFNASVDHLSLGQAALLAGLAHAPSSDNPLVSLSRARRRQSVALARLQDLGHVSKEEVHRASQEPLMAAERGTPFLAPHFTSHLIQWAERDGHPLEGRWRTSLDLDLQTSLEAEVRHTVDLLADRGARQAAAVVLDNGSGEILAWVGSPDFWADTAGQVDMVVSQRQPGSALKPFLYGLALDRGFTTATVLPDIPRTFQTSSGPYHPRNYDRRFHGPVRAREALASSYNLPAVELADQIGFATLLHGLQEAGFTSLDRSAEHYGLGLALGNGDVTLVALANGYRALANGGLWRPFGWEVAEAGRRSGPTGLPDGRGSAGEAERRIMSTGAAALVLDILRDPVARIPGFGLQTPFDFPFPLAAKSGTSRHFTDNWAVGTTGRFTVAVWVGNFNGRPMEGVSGVSGAGPLLHRAVLATAERYPPGDLLTPAETGAVPITICRVSGLRAGAECPRMEEWFAPGTEPARLCDWHRDGVVELPVEYAEWEADGQSGPKGLPTGRWRAGGQGEASSRRSTNAGSPSSVAASPGFRIISPRNGDHYRVPPGVDPRYATLALRAAGGPGGEAVRWYVDGLSVRESRWALVPGNHVVRAQTTAGEADEIRIDVDR